MMKLFGRRAFLGLGVLALSLGAATSSVRADPMSLQDLINGTYGTIGVNTLTGHDVYINDPTFGKIDFVFGAGSYVPSGVGSPAASAITVTGLTVPPNIDALKFVANWFAAGSNSNDTDISYTVHVLSGSPVTDLHLDVTGGTDGNGFFLG
jgi:hypothetical protein